jgi:hypothetical protein
MATWNDYLKEAQLYGGAPGILNYGIDTLANKFNNYAGSNQRLDYDQGLSDWGSTMGNVPDAPSMPPMLDQTGQMGASNYRAPQGITFDPAQGNRGRWDQQNVPDEPGFLKRTGNKIKDLASQAKGAPLGLLNLLTQRQGATESFGGYPGSGYGSRAGLFPQEVSNLEELAASGNLGYQGQDIAGTNVVSQFGDYNKHMAEKKAQFTAKLKGDETLKDLYDSYIEKYGKNSAIAKRLNLYANFGGATDVSAADKITTGAPEFITRDGVTPSGPVTTGGGGTFNPMLDERGRVHRGTSPAPSWRGATAAREARNEQVAGPGFGQGAYWAEGGRVGYQDGELVEDEYMAEATPGGMMEENIEEVQGEPSREQLEAIAFEIFRLPLEELNEEQLNVVYQAAMEQEPSEEEVQFAAQEGPGEGIASLV